MKKLRVFAIVILAIFAFASPAIAAGGQNHGDVGQGSVHSHSQPDNLPGYNGPQRP